MHPIEHLRHVARASGVDPSVLVAETATALASLGGSHADLVIACKRVIERHVAIGPMWWLCSTLLSDGADAVDPWEVADRLAADPTPKRLAEALPDSPTVLTVGRPDVAGAGLMSRGDATVSCFDSRFEAGGFLRSLERVDIACEPTQPECLALVARTADVVVVEATAVSPLRVLSPVGSHVVAAVAASVGTPVWLVAGVGRRLPPEYVDVIAALTDADGSGVDEPSVEELPLRLVDLVVTEDGTCPPDRIESACPLVPGLTRIGRR